MALTETIVKSLEDLETDLVSVPTFDSGTYTTALIGKSGAFSTFSNKGGYYQKVGNMVTFWSKVEATTSSVVVYATMTLPPWFTHKSGTAQWHMVGSVRGKNILGGYPTSSGDRTVRFDWFQDTTSMTRVWFEVTLWMD